MHLLIRLVKMSLCGHIEVSLDNSNLIFVNEKELRSI